jgi:hypothetical protein
LQCFRCGNYGHALHGPNGEYCSVPLCAICGVNIGTDRHWANKCTPGVSFGADTGPSTKRARS